MLTSRNNSSQTNYRNLKPQQCGFFLCLCTVIIPHAESKEFYKMIFLKINKLINIIYRIATKFLS